MTVKLPSWLTVGLTGVASALPMFLPMIPPPYNALASGVIALFGAVYHLYVPSPSAK